MSFLTTVGQFLQAKHEREYRLRLQVIAAAQKRREMITQKEIDDWYFQKDEHPAVTYYDWQPTYAAYTSWTDKGRRQEQAIREMVSEAGEVEGVVAKAARKGVPIPRDKIVDELGDVLWGLVGVMNEFDISWHEIIHFNMAKLRKRNGE